MVTDFFLEFLAAGWWSCFDCGALWQLAAQSVIVPPQGLQETGIMAGAAVNYVADHRPEGGGQAESIGGKRERGRQNTREGGERVNANFKDII